MWKFVNNYSLKTDENINDASLETKEESFEPVWYFMDHYGKFGALTLCWISNFSIFSGTHIGWSIDEDLVNVKISPFIFIPTMTSYSVMWIVKPIDVGDPIVREHSYALNCQSDLLKEVAMIPWDSPPDFEGWLSIWYSVNSQHFFHKPFDSFTILSWASPKSLDLVKSELFMGCLKPFSMSKNCSFRSPFLSNYNLHLQRYNLVIIVSIVDLLSIMKSLKTTGPFRFKA